MTALAAAPASAQTPQASENIRPQDVIVVTAQKREQSINDVAINLSAFSGERLEDLGVSDFSALAEYTPGLQVEQQGASRPTFVMRGITSEGGESTEEPRVAIFQDGVSLSRTRGAYVELFDLERVEVAKGPQATLFGRSALTGAINIIQNKASYEGPAFIADATLGDVGQRALTGIVNQTLIDDRLAVRFSARHREQDGFVGNTLGGRLGDFEVDAYRLALRFDPADNLRFDLIGAYQEDHSSAGAYVSNRIANANGVIDFYDVASQSTLTGFQGGRPLGLDRTIDSLTLLGEWELSPAATLSSISGHRRFDSREVFDPDGSYVPLFAFAEYAEGDQFSQELRFDWDNGGALSWFAGVSYFHETGSQNISLGFEERIALGMLTGDLQNAFPSPDVGYFQNPVTSAALLQAYASDNGLALPADQAAGIAANLRGLHQEYFTDFSETDSYDLYADVTYRPAERWEFSLGVRYTRDEKTSAHQSGIIGAERSALGGFVGAFNPAAPEAFRPVLLSLLSQPGAPDIPQSGAYPLPNIALFTQPSAGIDEHSGTFDAVTWRAVARREWSDNASLWASVARGRRPEVISTEGPAAPGGPARFTELPAEWVTSYELGGALTLLGGGLNLNGSIYSYSYSDFQTLEFVSGRLITVTAGDAEAYGFEGQALLALSADAQLFANYSYNHARFASGAREGNSFRLSPDHSISVGAFLSWPAPGGRFYARPSYSWRSDVFFDDDNDRPEFQDQRVVPTLSDTVIDERQSSYGLLNLRAGFESADGTWALGVYALNALDEDYLSDGGSAGDSFGLPTFSRGAGRLLGVELSVRY